MPDYTKTGPFINSSAPGISAAFLNAVEDHLDAVQYGTNFITPYRLLNTVTINSGTTNNYTCTGVGGIPSGTKGVLIAYAFTANAINTYATFTPQGTAQANGNYPVSPLAQISSSIVLAGSCIVPLNTANGQIDIKAINGNCTSFDVQIYGYIY